MSSILKWRLIYRFFFVFNSAKKSNPKIKLPYNNHPSSCVESSQNTLSERHAPPNTLPTPCDTVSTDSKKKQAQANGSASPLLWRLKWSRLNPPLLGYWIKKPPPSCPFPSAFYSNPFSRVFTRTHRGIPPFLYTAHPCRATPTPAALPLHCSDPMTQFRSSGRKFIFSRVLWRY